MSEETRAKWIVARTRTGQEPRARDNIERIGLEPFLPRILNESGKPESLFPGYIFVRTLGEWRGLLSTYGVIAVVMRGEAPDTVPEKVVMAMRRRVRAGFIYLPRRERVVDPSRFKEGQRIRIIGGPFASFYGMYLGMKSKERVRILHSLFGRQSEVELDLDQIEEA